MNPRHYVSPFRTNRLPASSIAALLCAASLAPSAGAEDIYWIESVNQCNQNLIRRTTVGSGQIVDLKNTTNNFGHVDVDVVGGHVYWNLRTNGPDLLLRSNLDGAGETQIASVDQPLDLEAFAIDRASGKVYWLETIGCSPCSNGGPLCAACPRFRRANLDGTGVETLFTFPAGTTSNHSDIAVDSAGGKIYWCDRQFAPHLSRCNLDGSNAQTLATVAAPFGGVSEFALDVAGGRLYWIETGSFIPGEARMVRANLDGTNVQELVRYPSQTPTPRGLALDVSCGKFYWTLSGFCPNDADGRIIRANLDGTQVEDRSTGRLVMLSVAIPAGSSCATTTPPCGACGAGVGLMSSIALLFMGVLRRSRRRRA